MSSIIVLDSSDEETGTSAKGVGKKRASKLLCKETIEIKEKEDDRKLSSLKRRSSASIDGDDKEKRSVKRIKPTQISTIVQKPAVIPSTANLNINGNAKAMTITFVEESPVKISLDSSIELTPVKNGPPVIEVPNRPEFGMVISKTEVPKTPEKSKTPHLIEISNTPEMCKALMEPTNTPEQNKVPPDVSNKPESSTGALDLSEKLTSNPKSSTGALDLSEKLTSKPKSSTGVLDLSEKQISDNGGSCLPERVDEKQKDKAEETATTSTEQPPPPADESTVNPIFASLLVACRAADPSEDMETLIKKKLVKYYHSVHPDFVNSKSFSRTTKKVISDINRQPNLVYFHLKNIVEELKTRKKSMLTVMTNEEITTTGNKKRDVQIKRLSHGLHKLTKKIAKLEAADVDFDEDDNSTYIQVERLKRRACEIYEKICDLTGESKHAHRLVKKPITFKGTQYPQFNRVVQAFVNKNNAFPDFYDVLTCLEHCNKKYNFGLLPAEMRLIAQDAFVKIGKALQSRRKTDLYETVTHFTGAESDPAEKDPELLAKLAENQKHYSKITNIINKYACKGHESDSKEQGNGGSSSERLNSSKERASCSEDENSSKNLGRKEIEKNNNKVKVKDPTKDQNGCGNDSSTTSVPSPGLQVTRKAKKITDPKSCSSKVEEIVISDEEES